MKSWHKLQIQQCYRNIWSTWNFKWLKIADNYCMDTQHVANNRCYLLIIGGIHHQVSTIATPSRMFLETWGSQHDEMEVKSMDKVNGGDIRLWQNYTLSCKLRMNDNWGLTLWRWTNCIEKGQILMTNTSDETLCFYSIYGCYHPYKLILAPYASFFLIDDKIW